MILLQILEHDLHRRRTASPDAQLWWIETPARPEFLPAVVSSTRGDRFLVSRKLADGRLRSGVFRYDSDRLDEILEPLFSSAYELSVAEGWKNVFDRPQDAFAYIQKASGTTTQPHALLVPEAWTHSVLARWAGKEHLSEVALTERGPMAAKRVKAMPRTTAILYRGVCKVMRCKVAVPVFLSRPDFVGMYTQVAGGMTSIMLHNVQHGIAFCPRIGKN